MPTDAEQSVADGEGRAKHDEPGLRAEGLRTVFSRASLVVAVTLLAAAFLLLSPPRGQTYPGAIPWGEFSVLRPLTELLSLGGLAATTRGVEIKQFALHVASVVGLLLLAGRFWYVHSGVLTLRRMRQPWFGAQLLLAGWVMLSALSALWSGDPHSAYGQAALYGLALVWAIGLGWTLDARDVPRLLAGLVVVSSLAAALCVWYYFERNPHHRPGFPVGNPGQLAAALLPAIIIAISTVVGGLVRWWQAGRVQLSLRLAGAVVALIPLLWCFVLTNSRAAMLGLAVGLGTLILLQSGQRMRWAIVGVMLLGIAGAGAWLTSYSRLDAAMARGASVRFRYYAWRYAAELWNQSVPTSVAGQGAGAYPRLAGQLSIRDRTLDPAAFMGELVEHAHNELFEVLTEIGLVGGVTFVGGWLAVLAAGAALRRGAGRQETRWLYAALVAALAALMVNGLAWPGLRLVVVPAVFYTLLGILWAASRCATRPEAADAIAALLGGSARSTGGRPPHFTIAAVVAVLLAVGAGWLSLRDWAGAVHEEAGHFAAANGDFDQAVRRLELAEARLLDPVRQLVSDGAALDYRLAAARMACGEFLTQQGVDDDASSQPTTAAALRDGLRWRAIEHCEMAYVAAGRLSHRVPTQLRVGASAANAAEMLANLYAETEPDTAREWHQRAMQAWYVQRRWRPFDVETLLALTRLTLERPSAPLNLHISLLRDALRTPPIWREWHEALRWVASRPKFAQTLDGFLAGVGPVSPETDLDTLIASLAPEVYRLAAYYHGLRGEFAAAQDLAAQAAALYEPMRPRFPTLHSVGLREQAEFALRESYERGPSAVALLREAIDRLPVIQQQKHEAQARPLWSWLALALLATGDEHEAADVLRAVVDEEALVPGALAESYVQLAMLYLQRPSEQRGPVDTWLAAALRHQPDHFTAWAWTVWLLAERGDVTAADRALADAARAGVTPEGLERIRASLRQEFPELRQGNEGGGGS